jgi:uncharacterized protein
MRQYERSGITVDQCAECRGIFLDRGELERLMDAETAYHAAAPPPQPQPQPRHQTAPPGRGYRDYDSDEYPVYDQQHQRRPHKKRSFLGELFD